MFRKKDLTSIRNLFHTVWELRAHLSTPHSSINIFTYIQKHEHSTTCCAGTWSTWLRPRIYSIKIVFQLASNWLTLSRLTRKCSLTKYMRTKQSLKISWLKFGLSTGQIIYPYWTNSNCHNNTSLNIFQILILVFRKYTHFLSTCYQASCVKDTSKETVFGLNMIQ